MNNHHNSFPLYGGRLGWGFGFVMTPHLHPPPSATKLGVIHPDEWTNLAATFGGKDLSFRFFGGQDRPAPEDQVAIRRSNNRRPSASE